MQSKDLTTPNLELALARKPTVTKVPVEMIEKLPNLTAAVNLCIQLSGLEEKELHLPLQIDAGHWTRITKGDAHFPLNKLGVVMDLCGNEAPLLWMANCRGYGLVVLKTESERRAEAAERALQEAQSSIRLLTDLLQGRARA